MQHQSSQGEAVYQSYNNKQSSSRGSTLIVWFIFFCCIAVTAALVFGSQTDQQASKRTAYKKIGKKIDGNKRTILIGDQEDGVGIFINYFVSKKNSEGKVIKRRDYYPGKDLLYKNGNILNIFTQTTQPTLWIIETDNSLTLDDIDSIHQFIEQRPQSDQIIIVTQAVSNKAQKIYPKFKIIKFENIEKADVQKHLMKQHKLDKVDVKNLFLVFDGDLQKINDFIHESEDLDNSFAESYAKQAQNLQYLLENQPQKVEKTLRKMCKTGFESVKQPHDYIQPINGIIQYSPSDNTYRWYSQKAILAVSDKYDISCNTDVELIHLDFDTKTVQKQKPSKKTKQVQQVVLTKTKQKVNKKKVQQPTSKKQKKQKKKSKQSKKK